MRIKLRCISENSALEYETIDNIDRNNNSISRSRRRINIEMKTKTNKSGSTANSDKIKRALIQARNSVRTKFRQLHNQRANFDYSINETYKPITGPLKALLKVKEDGSSSTKQTVKPTWKKEEEDDDDDDESETETPKSIFQTAKTNRGDDDRVAGKKPTKTQRSLVFDTKSRANDEPSSSIRESNNQNISGIYDVLASDDDENGAESLERQQQRQGSMVKDEAKISMGKLMEYINDNPTNSPDKHYGFRKDKKNTNILLGNDIVRLKGAKPNYVYSVNGKSFPVTTGLTRLLVEHNPKQNLYSENDLNVYKEMLTHTNAHKEGYRHTAKIRRKNNSEKYDSIIRQLFPPPAVPVSSRKIVTRRNTVAVDRLDDIESTKKTATKRGSGVVVSAAASIDNEKLKRTLIKARNTIRKKFEQLHNQRLNFNYATKEQFKPITEPLHALVKKNTITTTDVKTKPASATAKREGEFDMPLPQQEYVKKEEEETEEEEFEDAEWSETPKKKKTPRKKFGKRKWFTSTNKSFTSLPRKIAKLQSKQETQEENERATRKAKLAAELAKSYLSDRADPQKLQDELMDIDSGVAFDLSGLKGSIGDEELSAAAPSSANLSDVPPPQPENRTIDIQSSSLANITQGKDRSTEFMDRLKSASVKKNIGGLQGIMYSVYTDKDKDPNQVYLGNEPITVKEGNKEKELLFVVNDQEFPLTKGLTSLLMSEAPKDYNPNELELYKQMIKLTSAHKSSFNPKSSIYRLRGRTKYDTIISELFPIAKGNGLGVTSGGCIYKKPQMNYKSLSLKNRVGKINYTYWDDPNELVDRLRILLASKSAGHTGHENEMISIIEELREAKIIK